MTIEQSPQREGPLNIIFENRERRTVASYKRELVRSRRAESGLREALAREPALPEGFDPAAGKGLGMRIIRSLVERIGGELRIGRGDESQGARFTVRFS
jgi:two-component sensor histidine kinase